MGKAINDATLTKLGDIFQYYIALRDCFELNDNETLQIEVNGDISIISNPFSRFQKEVKHHVDKKYLADRNIEVWKTLANWYCDFERIKTFTKLILFTTSDIKEDSVWNNWNNLENVDKLGKIKEVGAYKKNDEIGFRKQYNRIFSEVYDESKLLEVLSKFSIQHAKNNITGISSEFTKYVGHIPPENRDSYIGALLGQVLATVQAPPHKWEVTRESFELILQKTSPSFSKSGQRPLPVDFSNESVPEINFKKLENKRFVDAIHDIEHDCMIHQAISDYWKSDLTIMRYFQDDFLYLQDLTRYRVDLCSKLQFEKDSVQRKARGKTANECLDLSKDYYNSVMGWDAKDFGSIIRNQDFFQRGIIHNIVDDNETEWKVGELNNGN